MKKTLLHYRNPDSTLDLITMLSEFFSKGIVSGGTVQEVWPNSIPQITISPFKLIGTDGMVVLETSDTETLTLPVNQTTVVCFHSEYVANNDPIYGFELHEISAYNALTSLEKAKLTIFALVTTAGATELPVIDLDLRNVIDPVSRNTLRGTVTSVSLLPVSGMRIGDAYVVESGLDDPSDGIYVWKGSLLNWVNLTDNAALSDTLDLHRSNLLADEVHLTNDQADAVAGTAGIPSALNPFVTTEDPRLPTQDEKDALAGLSQNDPTDPSSINPYVTAAYNLAEPSSFYVASAGALIYLPDTQGPFHVGMGVGMASAVPYFGIFDPSEKREYLNSAGGKVTITGVYKDSAGVIPLDPSSETIVADSNGFFFAGAAPNGIYLSYSGVIDTPCLISYGKQLNLQNIDRGAMLKPGPQDAMTSGETLERLAEISGRLFDDPMQTGETNVELNQRQLDIRRYLNTTTASDLVVPGRIFPHLREISDIAADFAADYGEILEFGSTPASYTTYWAASDVANFDPGYDEDAPMTAYVEYSGASLPAVEQGWIWEDDFGVRFRILAYNSVDETILLYTQGRPINVNNSNGNQSKIYRANNPRQLEIKADHALSMYREFFVVDEIHPIKDQFEELPPGGSFNSTYAPVNNFSLIGDKVLPNQGNAAGASRGRPLYYVKPFTSGQIPDPRIILVGNWKEDFQEHQRQAMGNLSQGSLGIEFTGRVTNLTLYTKIRPNMPYGFRVFVDGAYNHAASQFLTGPEIAAGLLPSDALNALRGDMEKSMQPLYFNNLGISDSEIHTVRIEITEEGGGDYFPLYAIEVFHAGAIESKGSAFASTDFVQTATDEVIATPIQSAARGKKIVRYLDRTTKARTVATSNMPSVYDNAVTALLGASTLNTTQSQHLNPGDVLSLTTRNNTPHDTANYMMAKVTAVDKFAGTTTIHTPLTFNMTPASSRLELAFRIPMSPDGTAIAGAPKSWFQQEYARFYLADWSVNLSTDVKFLSEGFADTRLTVLEDASTALSIFEGRRVSTNIEGFTEAIRLETTNSVMTLTGWCTGMDVVFVGSSGVSSTVDIEIDGMVSYQITLPNDGMLRHSLFLDAAPQSHVVKISNPSVAAQVAIGQWIFHSIKAPAVQGTVLADYEVGRNATSSNPAYFDFAPSVMSNSRVVSNCGVRLLDITKMGARLYEGTTGTQDWTVVQDTALCPVFFKYLETDRANATLEIQFIGSHFEFYYIAGPDTCIADMYLDGVVASSTNYPGQVLGTGYSGVAGQLDMYAASQGVRRIIFTDLDFGQHVFRIQQSGTKNISSSDYVMTAMMAAENPGSSAILRRFAEDPHINRIHQSSFHDARQFLSLTSEQVGVVSVFSEDVSEPPTPMGYLNAAFAMSDGSGTEINCTVGVALGVSIVDLAFPYTLALNPGLTVGDLDVFVDGEAVPRKVAGATLDTWYEEDQITIGRLKFWTDLSGSPVKIEVRRRQGTIDTSTVNTGRLATQAGVVVGTVSQVAAGIADYSSLNSAIAASVTGGKITLLGGVSITESVVLNKRLFIEGAGYDSQINGTFTIQNSADYCTVKSLYPDQFILDVGAIGCQVLDCFWDTLPSDANTLGTNRITGMTV